MRPLQSLPSVSIAPPPQTHTPAAVGNASATPPRQKAPGRNGAGFPGSRATAAADAPTLSAKDVPCPQHPREPAGRCQPCERAAVADPAAKAARAAAARAAIKPRRKGSNPTRTLRDLQAARTLADEATTDQEATG